VLKLKKLGLKESERVMNAMTMNLLVVPMSRIPARPFVLQNIVTGMLILIVMVGMPVAFIVPKYYLHRQHRAHSKLLAETVHDGE
jgi:hypothetical protein